MGIRHSARLAGGAALAAFLGGAAPAPVPPAMSDRQLVQTLDAMDAAARSGDCDKVEALGAPLAGARSGKVGAQLQVAVLTASAQCEYAAGAKEKAYTRASQGTASAESPDELWRMRLWLEIDARRYAAAVATVEAMGAGRRAALNTVPLPWLHKLNREMKEAGLTAERKRLLSVLTSNGYAPVETTGDAGFFHYAYAELLAEEGDAAGARIALASVIDAGLLLGAVLDARLAPLLPAGFDLRAAAEAALVRDRTLAAQNPRRLDPLTAVAADLRRLGRPQEVLDLLQPILAARDGGRAYTDARQKLPWVWDEVGRANEMLGRYDEAVRAFQAGAALGEDGRPNVSQAINLAHLQLRFGHPADALKTLAVFDDPKRLASPYGYMEMRLARGCAGAAAGRTAAAAADLAYAEAHAKDHPDALGYFYLCLDRMNDAAAFFIRGLDDPEQRVHMLRLLSDYDPPPAPVPPPFGGKLEALKARSDVKAAIARAGGPRRIPLQASGL